jgi:Domain of Unknown Function (DUF1206)
MATASSVRGTARRTAHSGWLEALTRFGFLGYGVFHLALAWLAIQIAVSHSPTHADQVGAFQLLEKQPTGRILLVVVAVGLAAMALWQLLAALLGPTYGSTKSRTTDRLTSAARVIVYGFLLYTDIKVITGTAKSSSSTQENATAGVLAHPAGQWLIALAGVIVFAIGAGMTIYGIKKSFRPKLDLTTAGASTRKSVLTLGQLGYTAKGIAFGIVGAILFHAAISDSATRSKGLDGALRTLAGEPFGTFLLIVVAIGFAAYGIYCFAQSKYRKI